MIGWWSHGVRSRAAIGVFFAGGFFCFLLFAMVLALFSKDWR